MAFAGAFFPDCTEFTICRTCTFATNVRCRLALCSLARLVLLCIWQFAGGTLAIEALFSLTSLAAIAFFAILAALTTRDFCLNHASANALTVVTCVTIHRTLAWQGLGGGDVGVGRKGKQ
jgi:hypothetical protein